MFVLSRIVVLENRCSFIHVLSQEWNSRKGKTKHAETGNCAGQAKVLSLFCTSDSNGMLYIFQTYVGFTGFCKLWPSAPICCHVSMQASNFLLVSNHKCTFMSALNEYAYFITLEAYT